MKKLFTFLVFAASILTMMAADIVVTTVADDSGDAGVPAGSFREAVTNAASGDVIRFNVTDGDKIELKSTISFAGADKVFVIEGLNQATGKPMVFNKSSEAAINMRLINIANGAGSIGLDVTIKNASFEDVSMGDATTTGSGAVISAGNSAYNTAGQTDFKVTLEGCRFMNNTSYVLQSATSGGGAAILISHGVDLLIKNCLFVNNRSLFSENPDGSKPVGGGAIASTGNNTAHLTAINSTFYGNYTDGRGGSIFVGHPADLINCTFAGNIGQRAAGFYFHNNNPCNVINCIFTYNYSLMEGYTENGDFYKGNGSFPTFSNNIVGGTNLGDVTLLGTNNVEFFDIMPLFDTYSTDESNNKVPVLANNGGYFETVALKAGGIASGEGIASSDGFDIPTNDQRGFPRASSPSMGAYEYGAISGVNAPTFVSGGINAIGKQILFAAGMNGSAKIYNLAGTCVYHAQLNGGGLTPAFNDGVYIVKFVNQNGSALISKVILK